MDLYDQVLHLLEGEEIRHETTRDGESEQPIEYKTSGTERWIGRVHESGVLTGLELLAVILFIIRDLDDINRDPTKIVGPWSIAVTDAIKQGVIVARDRNSYLPLETEVKGWNWVLPLDVADSFLSSYGIGWSCTQIVEHLFLDAFPVSKSAVVSTAEGQKTTEKSLGGTNEKRWTDAMLRNLLDEKKEFGMTQKKLGEKYNLSYQRIGALIKKAEQLFGRSGRRPLPILTSTIHRIKK